MSKEEIVAKHLKAYCLGIGDIAFGTSVIPALIYRAMDEWAKT